jgi:hypothetical protein
MSAGFHEQAGAAAAELRERIDDLQAIDRPPGL